MQIRADGGQAVRWDWRLDDQPGCHAPVSGHLADPIPENPPSDKGSDQNASGSDERPSGEVWPSGSEGYAAAI